MRPRAALRAFGWRPWAALRAFGWRPWAALRAFGWRPGARIAVAGGLIAVGLGVPLVFMWVSGQAAAQAEHDKILAEPVAVARAAAERIAARVTGELTELAEREERGRTTSGRA